jgi:hypothetical protein
LRSLASMPLTKESLRDERTPLLSASNRGRDEDGTASENAIDPLKVTGEEDLDVRLKRWLDYIARRHPRKSKDTPALEISPQFLISVFEKQEDEPERPIEGPIQRWEGFIDDDDFTR